MTIIVACLLTHSRVNRGLKFKKQKSWKRTQFALYKVSSIHNPECDSKISCHKWKDKPSDLSRQLHPCEVKITVEPQVFVSMLSVPQRSGQNTGRCTTGELHCVHTHTAQSYLLMAVKSLSWMDGDGQMAGLRKWTKALRSNCQANGHIDHIHIIVVGCKLKAIDAVMDQEIHGTTVVSS